MPYNWRNGKPINTIIRIELSVFWRKFNAKTRGLAFLYLLIILTLPVMLIIQLLPQLEQQSQAPSNLYYNQMKINCADKDFYIPWFTYCENIGVRPGVFAK